MVLRLHQYRANQTLAIRKMPHSPMGKLPNRSESQLRHRHRKQQRSDARQTDSRPQLESTPAFASRAVRYLNIVKFRSMRYQTGSELEQWIFSSVFAVLGLLLFYTC